MAQFPNYRVQSVAVKGDKCTATLVTTTQCGPRITEKATIRISNKLEKLAKSDPVQALREVEALAVSAAERNLAHSHQAVVVACRIRGTHKHA